MHLLEIKSMLNLLLVNFSVSRAQLFNDPSMYTDTDRDMKIIFSFSLSKESGSGEDDRRSQPRR